MQPFNRIDFSRSKDIKKTYIKRIDKAVTLKDLARIMYGLNCNTGMKQDDWDFVQGKLLEKREMIHQRR